MIIGIKIITVTSITINVSWLDDASHTSKLEEGVDDDGSMKGNILTPTVAIIPISLNALHINASTRQPAIALKNTATSPANPSTGATIANG